jgi:hypothetical protein
MEAGLLRGSFVAPKPQRQLRTLTRYRKTQIAESAILAHLDFLDEQIGRRHCVLVLNLKQRATRQSKANGSVLLLRRERRRRPRE